MGLKEKFADQINWYRMTFALREEEIDKLDRGEVVDVKFKGEHFALQKYS